MDFRSPLKRWILKFIFSIDGLFFIGVMITVLYFLFTTKRKKYKYQGLWGKPIKDIIKRARSKKKKPRGRFNKHEERCREIFQQIFGKRFKSCRPDWLKNPVTGRNLEIDGFCEDVSTSIGRGLGFEYDGKQHAKYTPHFHRGGPDEFIYQTKKDDWKDMTCKKRRVLLIRIPHFVAYQDLERYIHQQLRRNGLGTFIDESFHKPKKVFEDENDDDTSEDEEDLDVDDYDTEGPPATGYIPGYTVGRGQTRGHSSHPNSSNPGRPGRPPNYSHNYINFYNQMNATRPVPLRGLYR